MIDFKAACVSECNTDLDCDGMKKCCKNDCDHHACHIPVKYDGEYLIMLKNSILLYNFLVMKN